MSERPWWMLTVDTVTRLDLVHPDAIATAQHEHTMRLIRERSVVGKMGQRTLGGYDWSRLCEGIFQDEEQ